MFTKQELGIVISTLNQRREWLLKNRDAPANQQALQLLESALAKLATLNTESTETAAGRTKLAPEKIRVLIVDDDHQVAMLISTLLTSCGIKFIKVADNGHQAISMIYDAKPAFDLVLCDWNMPIKNGLDVHNAMRASERYQDTCFMLVTAVTEAKQIRAAISEGVDDYIVKPIDESALLRKIARAFPTIKVTE